VENQPAPREPLKPPDARIEERLRVLKRLWDQGLITEEEYRQKKKQLLDRF
jgi:membrane peptidoglycan carboxypeptidase